MSRSVGFFSVLAGVPWALAAALAMAACEEPAKDQDACQTLIDDVCVCYGTSARRCKEASDSVAQAEEEDQDRLPSGCRAALDLFRCPSSLKVPDGLE